MLIFEYLPAGNLHDRILRAPLTYSEAIDLGITMCSVLERIHSAGILHRDIKPSNIGYQDFATPKLLDFGLAHIIREQANWHVGCPEVGAEVGPDAKTIPGWRSDSWDGAKRYLAGTPQYMAPELFDESWDHPSADLWALTMMLYEAMTGLNPMLRPTVEQTLKCVFDGRVPDIRTYLPACPVPVSEYFAVALARKPSLRPPSARAMRSKLENLQSVLLDAS